MMEHALLADNSMMNPGATMTPNTLNIMKSSHEHDDDKYEGHLIPSPRTRIPSRDPIPDSKYESNNSLV